MPEKKCKEMDENVKNFTEEVEVIGKRMERKGSRLSGWYYDTFGALAPVVSAIIGMLMLAVLILTLNAISASAGAVWISSLSGFLSSNIWTFFLIFLVTSSFSYFSRCCPGRYLMFSPFSAAFGITVFLWAAANVTIVADFNARLTAVASHVANNLFPVFWVFLVLGYFVLLIRFIFGGVANMKATEREIRGRRLYRSGKEKVLGGVCGGIAEYFGVDPVLIRLIWVVLTLAWGTGLLLYIIAWIIIPRNPKHKWE